MIKDKKTFIFLILILLLGSVLRFWGLKLDLPAVYHPDEHFLVYYGLEIPARFGNPGWFGYPSLCMYILTFLNVIWFVIAFITGNVSSWGDFYKWYQDDPTAFYLLARTITVIWGLFTIWLLYFWGKKENNIKVGLLSALALSVVFIHVRESHFATVDVPLTALMTAGSICLMQLVRTKEKFWFWGSILCTGLAAGCKYTGIFLYPGIVTAIILTEQKNKIFSKSLIAFISIIFIFILTTPFSVLDFPKFLEDIRYQIYASNNSGMLFNAKQHWWYYFNSSFWDGMGRLLGIIGLIGFVYAIIKRKKNNLPIIIWMFVYLLWISISVRGWIRWSLPLIPFLIYFGCEWLNNTINKFKSNKIWIIYIICILTNLTLSYKFDNTITQLDDSRNVAIKWLIENATDNSVIFRGNFGPDANLLEKAGFTVITDRSLLSDRDAFTTGKPFLPKPTDIPKTNKDIYFIYDNFSYFPLEISKFSKNAGQRGEYKIWYENILKISSLENSITVFYKSNLLEDIAFINKRNLWEEIYAPYTFWINGPDVYIYKMKNK